MMKKMLETKGARTGSSWDTPHFLVAGVKVFQEVRLRNILK